MYAITSFNVLLNSDVWLLQLLDDWFLQIKRMCTSMTHCFSFDINAVVKYSPNYFAIEIEIMFNDSQFIILMLIYHITAAYVQQDQIHQRINVCFLAYSIYASLNEMGFFFGEHSRLVGPIRFGSILNQFKIDQSKILLFFQRSSYSFNIENKFYLLLKGIKDEEFYEISCYIFFCSQKIYIFLSELENTVNDVMRTQTSK